MPDSERISVTGSSRGQPGELHELRIPRPVRWHYQPEGMVIELTSGQLAELGEAVSQRLADCELPVRQIPAQQAGVRLRWPRGRGQVRP